MHSYDLFITSISLCKILFMIFGIWRFVLVKQNVGETELSYKLNIWKEYFEFIFVVSMGILCVYLFNPVKEVRPSINFETKILLFSFGWVLLIGGKWELIFGQSKWLALLQHFINGANDRYGLNIPFIVAF